MHIFHWDLSRRVNSQEERMPTLERSSARLLLLPPTSPWPKSASCSAHCLVALGLGMSRGGSFPAPLLLAPLLAAAQGVSA